MLRMAEQSINYRYLEEFFLWIYASCLFLLSCHNNSGDCIRNYANSKLKKERIYIYLYKYITCKINILYEYIYYVWLQALENLRGDS